MVGAEQTLLFQEHAHAPSFRSDCSKGFEAELAASAPQAPAVCSVQAWMGLVPASSKQDGAEKNPQNKVLSNLTLHIISLKVEAVCP